MNNKLEIELRAKVQERIVTQLLGKFPVQSETFQKDVYYKFISKPENSWIIRIREENKKYLLTYKSENQIPDGAWSEVETIINKETAQALHHFFLQNGFEIEVEINKKRKTVINNEITINIDEIESLGLFIEAEIFAFEKDIVSTQEKIRSYFIELGINPDEIVKKGYVTLMKEKIK